AVKEAGHNRCGGVTRTGVLHRHADPRVDLQARIPKLHLVAGTALGPFVALEVPVHDVPPTGPESEFDSRRVHDDAVPHRDRPNELGQDVRRPPVDLHPLQPLALGEQSGDRPRLEARHYRDAMSFSTRSSRALKGSLQSTVRWAWSLSFRRTQSTV